MLKKVIGLGALVAVLAVGMAVAQPGGMGGGMGGRGNFDPEQMAQMQAQRMQEQLGITAEEWVAIGPRVEKVQGLQQDLQRATGGRGRGGMMGAMGGGGRAGRGNRGATAAAEGEQSEIQQKLQALMTTLQSDSPSSDTITKQLTELRQAKEKVKQELVKAQAALKEVLSVRQEANAVVNGLLE